MIVVLVVIILLALNALFVAAEFAILAAPTMLLQQRAQDGNGMAGRVLTIQRDPVLQDQYIATCQLGITVASLGLGMYGEHHLAEWIFHHAGEVSWLQFLAVHSVAGAVAVACLTYLHVVLGEMIPKTLALQTSLPVVLFVTPLMLGFRFVLLPLVLILNGLGNVLLLLFGIERSPAARHVGVSDIRYAVQQSRDAGALAEGTAEVLDELLAFTHMDAGEVMVPRVRVAAIALDDDLTRVRQILMQAPHSRYPVYRESLDDILGFIHLKDLYLRMRQPDVEQLIQVHDVRELPFLPATSELETVLQTMQREASQMVVLMDEFGGTAGLLTLEDIMTELMGPIDANEIIDAELVPLSPGQWLVAGTLRLENLAEALALQVEVWEAFAEHWGVSDLKEELFQRLEHEEVESVSGLILDQLERVPQVGDRVCYEGFEFEVLEVAGRGVSRCRLGLQSDESSDTDEADDRA